MNYLDTLDFKRHIEFPMIRHLINLIYLVAVVVEQLILWSIVNRDSFDYHHLSIVDHVLLFIRERKKKTSIGKFTI